MSRLAMGARTVAAAKRFYGKFRGTVMNNVDPKRLGRIQVMVPDVSTTMISTWALPCFPWGGGNLGAGLFAVPLPGTGVWIEFEQGDPDFPIWTGCYVLSPAEVPPDALKAMPPIASVTVQTPFKNVLQLSDAPGPLGGIQLRTPSGAMISVNDLGITITNGKGATITMLGKTVDINSGALTVI